MQDSVSVTPDLITHLVMCIINQMRLAGDFQKQLEIVNGWRTLTITDRLSSEPSDLLAQAIE